ncbi:hypothetical protein ACS7C4_002413 [Salmonella enterica subsp. enterica serovar Newport]|uniref:Uncharacterized protein n=3 Tax=root TaxID=1 RepID=A0A0M5M7V4_9CAUD|nr:hypothetical protein SEN5_44 [Salmonella phage SEN5]YP_009218810.1 hypothetical protein SEN4_44 [Salmonella phage SEN4]EAR6706630.1 hypothetical protein [Salmonella enterica]EBO2950157.1 hypothetical protein [Salmonella enterica subsp. enterica serovar Newport]EBV6515826.1 hypothetical protein [Salmonella enterica subsp. enterica serovar Emek]EBW8924895.1 hypothetical protein [Salmonella enterica subsp. enterica serovar Infantis]ECB7116670.1 hypothetical protein [Salmonella enterica subsp.
MRIRVEFNCEDGRATAEITGWRWCADEMIDFVGVLKERFFSAEQPVKVKVSLRVLHAIVRLEGHSSQQRFAPKQNQLPPRKP